MLFPEVVEEMNHAFPEAYGHASTKSDLPTDKNAVMVYAMRHTSTDIDDANKSHGWINSPLNLKGMKEALELSKKGASVIPTKIISSDMNRALMTAYPISKATGVQLQPTPALRPLNTGIYQGQDAKKVHEILKPYFDNQQVKIPGGESVRDMHNRTLELLNNVLSQSQKGEKIILMGHSSLSRVLDQFSNQKSITQLDHDALQASNKHGDTPFIKTYKFHPKTGVFEHGK